MNILTLTIILKLFHPGAEAYAEHIETYAKQYKFDPLLVAAVISKESGFDPNICAGGSYGLMQIQLRGRSCKATAQEAKQRNLYDPKTNIREGVKIMAMWRHWGKGKPYHWLYHYNQGYGKCPKNTKHCKAKDRVPVLTGRRGEYANKIIATFNKLKRLQRNSSEGRRQVSVHARISNKNSIVDEI